MLIITNGKKTSRKQITTVHTHPRRVRVSRKNPGGITIVDEHLRRLPGSYLDPEEIDKIAKEYDLKDLVFPTAGKLPKYKNADKYDKLIAIWTDYFNKKFKAEPKLDPDVIKALIGSESGFNLNPKNPKAIGIAQITKETCKIMQDPKGETKDFIFSKIRQKDLKDPNIAIPMATRWIFRKRELAEHKLKRAPTDEEVILEYKGLLKSKSEWKNNALINFKETYELLKSK